MNTSEAEAYVEQVISELERNQIDLVLFTLFTQEGFTARKLLRFYARLVEVCNNVPLQRARDKLSEMGISEQPLLNIKENKALRREIAEADFRGKPE